MVMWTRRTGIGKWVLGIAALTCALTVVVGTARAESPAAPLNHTVSFQNASSGQDTLQVKAGTRTVKATSAEMIQGHGDSRITVISTPDSGTVPVASVTDRAGESLYTVEGEYVDGGEGGDGTKETWASGYNYGGARIILEINGSGPSDDEVVIGPDGATLTIRVAGDGSQTHMVDLADAGVGDVTYDSPVPVSSNGSETISLKGETLGAFTITGTSSTADAGSTSGKVVPKLTSVVVEGSNSVNHGESLHFTVRAFAGDVDITDHCSFAWIYHQSGFKGGDFTMEGEKDVGEGVEKDVEFMIHWDGKPIAPLWRNESPIPAQIEVVATYGTQSRSGYSEVINVNRGDVNSIIGLKELVQNQNNELGDPEVGAEDWFAPTPVPVQSSVELNVAKNTTLSVTASLAVEVSVEGGFNFGVATGSITNSVTVTAAGTVSSSKATTYSTSISYTPHTDKWTHVYMLLYSREATTDFKLLERYDHTTGLTLTYLVGTASQTAETYLTEKHAAYETSGPAN